MHSYFLLTPNRTHLCVSVLTALFLLLGLSQDLVYVLKEYHNTVMSTWYKCGLLSLVDESLISWCAVQ